MIAREIIWPFVLGTAFAIIVVVAAGSLSLIGYAISMMGVP